MASPLNPPEQDAGRSLIPAEWSAQAADAVVDTVDKIRDRTTRPLQVAARGLVYGIVLGVAGLAALVLVIVLALRMYDNWVPGPLWIAYAVLGALFMIGGLVCFGKASRPAPAP